MVLIIVVMLTWSLCVRVAEPKIVYSRLPRNDTTTMTTTATTVAVDEDDETGTTAVTTSYTTMMPGGRYSDNSKSMSLKNNVYGVEFYAPPVIHDTPATVDLFGRQLLPHQRHQPVHHHQRLPWEPAVTMVQEGGVGGGDGPILVNPLLAAHDDPSTVRYTTSRRQRPQPVLPRVIKYTEPATLAFVAAEADDRALLDNLPALQFAMQHATGKQPSVAPGPHPQFYPQRLPPPPQPPPPTLLRPHPLYRYGSGAQAARYTQVPFLYNLPAPPPAQRPLAPAEYDLVTQFNRLLKQRDRENDGQRNTDNDEEEETTTRPKAKTKKNKRKKKKRPSTTEKPPVSVEDDHEDEFERLEKEPLMSEEQETQNVHTSEKLPDDAIIEETGNDDQNAINEPSQLSQYFGAGALNFEDSQGERVEFQLHGMAGPESYKFGFDTGKGTNRQFRYEERDDSGNVRGHYGYLDHDGKMQVYNYVAHPEFGYHAQKAEAPAAPES